MDMIKARNLTSHTYNTDIASGIAGDILTRFYPAFAAMANTFAVLTQYPACAPPLPRPWTIYCCPTPLTCRCLQNSSTLSLKPIFSGLGSCSTSGKTGGNRSYPDGAHE